MFDVILNKCSCFYIENRRWNTDDLKEKYLYECLVNTVGTEINIRKKTAIYYERYGK